MVQWMCKDPSLTQFSPLLSVIAGSIEQMLATEKRKDLQTVFVAEGIFDTFVGFFHKITLTGNFPKIVHE